MKYVTLIYYTKNGKAMMMPFENSGENVQEAYQETQDALHRVNRQAKKQGVDITGIRARTFEFEVPSFDVR